MTPWESASASTPAANIRPTDRLHLDAPLLFLLLMLALFGLGVQYSASGHALSVVISQAERLAIGLVIMGLVAQAPPETYRLVAP